MRSHRLTLLLQPWILRGIARSTVRIHSFLATANTDVVFGHNPQMAGRIAVGQRGYDSTKDRHYMGAILRGQAQHNEPRPFAWRILSYVAEAQIESQEDTSLGFAHRCQPAIVDSLHVLIPNGRGIMAVRTQQSRHLRV